MPLHESHFFCTLPARVCWDLSLVISLEARRDNRTGFSGDLALSCKATASKEAITFPQAVQG